MKLGASRVLTYSKTCICCTTQLCHLLPAAYTYCTHYLCACVWPHPVSTSQLIVPGRNPSKHARACVAAAASRHVVGRALRRASSRFIALRCANHCRRVACCWVEALVGTRATNEGTRGPANKPEQLVGWCNAPVKLLETGKMGWLSHALTVTLHSTACLRAESACCSAACCLAATTFVVMNTIW